MSQHVLRIAGREYRAEVRELTPERAVVVVDGRSFEVDLVEVGRRAVAAERARPAPPGGGATAAMAVAPVATPPAPAARAAAAGEGGIAAPMPGLVLAIKVKDGEAVQAGQTLLVMEAMKMENAVASPYAGLVSKVYVREGDSVGEGDLLVDVARPKMAAL